MYLPVNGLPMQLDKTIGVMWSEALKPKISRGCRAVAFCTCCSGRIAEPLAPSCNNQARIILAWYDERLHQPNCNFSAKGGIQNGHILSASKK